MVVSSSGELDLDNLAPCTHEEADYRMTLHIYDLVRYHIRRLLLRSIDTDVPVICIAYFHDIPGLEELWIEFGTAKCYKLIPVHTIATHLHFLELARRLRMWTVWMENDKFTKAFLYLAKKQEDIPSEIMALLEVFVVCLYGSHLPQADIITINQARYELFHFDSKDFSAMPPTLDALQFHTAAYTAGHIWGKALVKAPVLHSPAH